MDADLLQALADGDKLWPWHWREIEASDDAAVVDALLTRLLGAPSNAEAHRAIEQLVRRSGRALGASHLREPRRVARLIEALARLPRPQSMGPEARDLFEGPRMVLRQAGAAALEPLRTVLDGPPRSVWYAASRIDGIYWPIGAKLTAMNVLQSAGDEADTPRLRRLADDLAEPEAVRCVARWLLVLRERPAEAVEAMAAALLSDAAANALYPDRWDLAAAGEWAAGAAVDCLVHKTALVRLRAAELLRHIGDPAEPAIRAFLARADAWVFVEAAEDVLARFSYRYGFGRLPSDRSLSRVAAPGDAYDLGLHPAEPEAES